MLTYDERTNTLFDPDAHDAVDCVIAQLGKHTNLAWGPRLARVTALEAAVKALLLTRKPGGEITREEIFARDQAARLVAQIEVCACGRCVHPDERCPCGACPACCEERCMPKDGRSDCGHCGTLEDRRDEDSDAPTLGVES